MSCSHRRNFSSRLIFNLNGGLRHKMDSSRLIANPTHAKYRKTTYTNSTLDQISIPQKPLFIPLPPSSHQRRVPSLPSQHSRTSSPSRYYSIQLLLHSRFLHPSLRSLAAEVVEQSVCERSSWRWKRSRRLRLSLLLTSLDLFVGWEGNDSALGRVRYQGKTYGLKSIS